MGSRPFLLFFAHPLTGHLTPTIRVAAALHGAGWDVTFVGPTAHKARIEKAGAHFVPLLGLADFDDLLYYAADNPVPPVPNYHALPWQERALVDARLTWIDTIPDGWASAKHALARLRARDPARDVVLVAEALFYGLWPMFLGADLPPGYDRRPMTAALSVTPPMIRSRDLPPFGFPGSVDSSDRGRRRHASMYAVLGRALQPLRHLLLVKLAEAGARRIPEHMLFAGENYTCYDAIMQLGVPSFFFPRTDWPEHFRIVGIIPAAQEPAPGWPDLPAWWAETIATADRQDKKLVLVAQGTVEVDPNNLILPTIEAMRHRDDVLVVAVLGRKGATLPPNFACPANVRVADYLHYDAILPHASVWVHNGGYGAVQHGMAHGVPMVTAGEGQDKTENCKRIVWSRAGLDLGTAKPTAKALREALGSVLDDSQFREGAQSLQRETRGLDTFALIEKTVLGLARNRMGASDALSRDSGTCSSVSSPHSSIQIKANMGPDR